MRLQFRWWGNFWRGWWQWGSRRTVTDKDYSIVGRGFQFGPLEFTWWPRSDWKDFCFTKEEADAEDKL